MERHSQSYNQLLTMSSKYTFNRLDEPSANVGLYGQARVAFVQKVYTVVSMQLLFTAIFCYLAIQSSQFYMFAITRNWLSYLSLIVCAISQIVVLVGKTSNQKIRIAALCVFTFFESYVVARICSQLCWSQTKYHGLVLNSEATSIVGQAALMTLVLVAILTVFAFYTKKDYTIGSALISMAISSLTLLMLVIMFSRNSFLHTVYIYLGIIVFGFYLIIDTQRIVGGKRMQLKSDEYITGAMLIYADIIVLFLKILSLLAQKKEQED